MIPKDRNEFSGQIDVRTSGCYSQEKILQECFDSDLYNRKIWPAACGDIKKRTFKALWSAMSAGKTRIENVS